MTQRFGVYVDFDNVVASHLIYGSPELSDLLLPLRRRYGSLSGPILFATNQWVNGLQGSGVVSRLTAEDRANMHVVKDADLALVHSVTSKLPQLDHLVLVSGDGDFAGLLRTAKSEGSETTIISPIQGTPVRLKLEADNWFDPEELLHEIEGILVPGDNAWVIPNLVRYFDRAQQSIVIIDNYVGPETIRLVSGTLPDVKLTIIGKRFLRSSETTAITEASALKNAGRYIQLLEHHDIHDRWFRVDDEWWHSGASLKDLGRKYSELNPARESYKVRQREDMLYRLLSTSVEIPL
jgi:NYN domain